VDLGERTALALCTSPGLPAVPAPEVALESALGSPGNLS
jgi:hypothetical protein